MGWTALEDALARDAERRLQGNVHVVHYFGGRVLGGERAMSGTPAMRGFILAKLLGERYGLSEAELRRAIPEVKYMFWDPYPGGAPKPLLYFDRESFELWLARKAERALEANDVQP